MRAPAAVADGAGAFTIDGIDVAAPRRDEVLVEMQAAGLCHTDHASLSWGRPLVMGHEGAGIVRSAGDGVSHVAAGDHVVLNWCIPCGRCAACARGDTVLCETSRPAHVMEATAGPAPSGGRRTHDTPCDTWL